MHYQRLPFSQISSLLPPDSWAVWCDSANPGRFDDEFIIVFEGSTELDSLNLDIPFEQTEPVSLILVKGDLRVKRYVYNQETDSATGLIVLGDLQAGNMLVGGQEIYITGNLLVDEVFWGDYNHGDLQVLGAAHANVFVETDDYTANIGGKAHFTHYLDQFGSEGYGASSDNGSPFRGLNEKIARQLFVPEFLHLEDNSISLVRNEFVLAQLEAGYSLLYR